MKFKGLGVGRIVHFVLPSGDIRPAIITRVINRESGRAGIHVFADPNDPPGIPYDERIGRPGISDFDGDADPKPMTWHWPPKLG